MTYRSRSVLALAVLATVTLAACGSDESHGAMNTAASSGSTASDTTSPASAIPADATFNAADVTFAQGMIPHHEQAIEMADIALDPKAGASAEVMNLAARIQGGQDPEIQTMKGWLAAWGQPEMGDMAGHDMSSMEGMMSSEDMDSLAALSGPEFDKAWLTMMIAHHEGAVKMAETVKSDGKDPAVASLADQVITAQTAEIAEMQGLLKA